LTAATACPRAGLKVQVVEAQPTLRAALAAYDDVVTHLAIIYYSATGHGTTMAQRVAAAAESAGAEVRLRHVAETHDAESFAHNPAWTANYEATKDLPPAAGDAIV
jgi:NAD(P)H dehydrogenase (quinone)